MRRLAAALSLVAALLLLALVAGCGEKDEPETTGPVVTAASTTSASTTTSTTSASTTTSTTGPEKASPEELIRAAISSFLTAGDPFVCERTLTARFVRRAYGDLKGCEAAQKPASAAKSVAISSLQIKDGTATATAAPRGGTSSGEKLKVELVGRGDSWLIDSLESNVPVGP